MLWELSVVEQRYRAVLEVRAGVSVVEVAERYGVRRETVHRWLRRFAEEGLAGLEDRSHRPREHPWRLPAELEARICELRRRHPRWGPRTLVFELERRGGGRVSRSTVYRALVRNGLIEPARRRRSRSSYRRWERPGSMQLWQIDVTASIFVGTAELKIVTGIDDHSRFCVMATIVARATARPVCRAFVEAMTTYGVPEEVLTDNGNVFTNRYRKPFTPREVLFDRICRENGISHRLTKVRSPTTTGKIERLHQTLQAELLVPHGPFECVEEAQAELDAWRQQYNGDRPHQALGMAFPITRFRPVPSGELALALPPELGAVDHESPLVGSVTPADGTDASVEVVELAGDELAHLSWAPGMGLEVDRVVPPSGNLWLGGQQIWLGPRLAGCLVRFWVDETHLHIMLDGARLKTLPSRLSVVDLGRLAANGARPAGPSPISAPTTSTAVEVDRLVNGVGLVGLLGAQHSVGFELAGRMVTLRFEGQLMAVTADGELVRTLPSPVAAKDHHRLRGARAATAAAPPPAEAVIVQRRVSTRGSVQVANERVQVGLTHAGKTVTIAVEAAVFRVIVDPDLTLVVARTGTDEVHRYKVSAMERTPRVRGTSTEAKTWRVK